MRFAFSCKPTELFLEITMSSRESKKKAGACSLHVASEIQVCIGGVLGKENFSKPVLLLNSKNVLKTTYRSPMERARKIHFTRLFILAKKREYRQSAKQLYRPIFRESFLSSTILQKVFQGRASGRQGQTQVTRWFLL